MISLILNRMSPELLIQIFEFISRRDVLELAATCKEWKDTIYNTPHLWRKLSWRDATTEYRQDICMSYLKHIIDVNTFTEGNTAKLFGLTRRYYFRYLHEIDFGFRAQRVNLLEEAHHFQSKEIATLSKAIFERCKNLKSLTVCAARLYDATLKTICDGCPNLEVNISFIKKCSENSLMKAWVI